MRPLPPKLSPYNTLESTNAGHKDDRCEVTAHIAADEALVRTAAVEEYSHTHNRPVFTQDTGSMADRVAARIMFTFIIVQCTHNILQ